MDQVQRMIKYEIMRDVRFEGEEDSYRFLDIYKSKEMESITDALI